ncbi:MAG: DNA-binding protein [Candidatus Nanohaloarchaea archaeon]
MDEDELEKLREQKKEELQEQQQSEEEALEEQKNQIRQQASQYLTKDAKERLGNIRAARPELASSIEMQIARLGKTGRIEKVTDSQLKDILKSFQKEKGKNDSDIKFRR